MRRCRREHVRQTHERHLVNQRARWLRRSHLNLKGRWLSVFHGRMRFMGGCVRNSEGYAGPISEAWSGISQAMRISCHESLQE